MAGTETASNRIREHRLRCDYTQLPLPSVSSAPTCRPQPTPEMVTAEGALQRPSANFATTMPLPYLHSTSNTAQGLVHASKDKTRQDKATCDTNKDKDMDDDDDRNSSIPVPPGLYSHLPVNMNPALTMVKNTTP